MEVKFKGCKDITLTIDYLPSSIPVGIYFRVEDKTFQWIERMYKRIEDIGFRRSNIRPYGAISEWTFGPNVSPQIYIDRVKPILDEVGAGYSMSVITRE